MSGQQSAFETPRDLLAFCHIEKAAGTSLIHVLRNVFLLRYAAARPLQPHTDVYMTPRDVASTLRLHPWLKGIGGHALVPFLDYGSTRNLRFITVFRDPVERTVSQFKFWKQRMGKSMSVDEFLSHPSASNFQVRKICGEDNLDRAKDILTDQFLLAGTSDQFDLFLVLLSRLITRPLALFTYQKRNTATDRPQMDISESFIDRLRELNRTDQQLVNWVRNDLVPGYVRDAGNGLKDDIAAFANMQNEPSSATARTLVDFAYRNGYLKPATGLIRKLNGLPYSGSYAFNPAKTRIP